MIEDGFGYSARSSLGPAAMQFMREHGVLKDIYKESESASHRTARGKNITHRTSKGPGFGPKGIMRYVVPCTVFLKLRDIGADVLPPYAKFPSIFPRIPIIRPRRAYPKTCRSWWGGTKPNPRSSRSVTSRHLRSTKLQ